MPAKLRRTKRTRKMRGGNEEVMTTTVQPVITEQPVVTNSSVMSVSAQPTLTENITSKAKNAVNFIKGWFGVGTQSAGGKRRKNRRKTVRRH